jgi:hypothetical protein
MSQNTIIKQHFALHETENSYDKISYASVEYNFEPFGVGTCESSMETNKLHVILKPITKCELQKPLVMEQHDNYVPNKRNNPLFRGCKKQ